MMTTLALIWGIVKKPLPDNPKYSFSSGSSGTGSVIGGSTPPLTGRKLAAKVGGQTTKDIKPIATIGK